MGNLLALIGASALVVLTTGCGAPGRTGQPPEAASEAPTVQIVWPGPPAEARIRYLRSISGPDDLGIKKSFWRKLFDVIAGKTQEQLIRPTGVAERDGVIYIADAGGRAVWIFDRPEQVFTQVHWAGDAELICPVAVAVRPDGSVFVADSWLKKLFLLDRHGKFLATLAEDGLERPAALAYDEKTDRLYVADSAGQRILVYASDGRRILSWGRRGSGDGEFNYPSYLTLDRSGALLVTDALNFRIQAFDPNGKFLWKFGHHGDGTGDFAAPKGVAIDNEGHIYVVDGLFNAVQIFGPKGMLLLGFGERGTELGDFWLPEGAFIDKDGRIYVADSYNQRVQVFEVIAHAEQTGSVNQVNSP